MNAFKMWSGLPARNTIYCCAIIGLLLCAMPLLIGAQTVTTGSITGRVTDDSGEPVMNAYVWVTTKGVKRSGPQRFASTDEDGKFEIRGLTPQAYGLQAAAPGYVSDESGDATYFVGGEATLQLVKGGVITGRVQDAAGKPLIALQIQALQLRDGKGAAVTDNRYRVAKTDDRGVYRIFGLPAGSYLVVTRDDARPNYRASAFDADAPLYYPSSTRDTALEVSVQLGTETTGIDLQYRSQPGYIVSGKVSGALPNSGFNAAQINLRHWPAGSVLPGSYATNRSGTLAYESLPIGDGEYEIQAVSEPSGSFDGARSVPRRIMVKGGDLSGVDLVLQPYAQLAGKVTIAAETEKPACRLARPLSLTEVVLIAPRLPLNAPLSDKNAEASERPIAQAVNVQGEWRLRGLEAGRYRFEIPLPGEDWYLKTTTIPDAKKVQQRLPLPLNLKAGEQVKDIAITLAPYAAAVTGKIKREKGDQRTLRIHLIPAATESADDVLRYAEAEVAADSSFAFKHLAPGKYWLLSLPREEKQISPLAFDAAQRAKLRQRASSEGQEITLAPCQRVTQLLLR